MTTESAKKDKQIQQNEWMIRPCHIYDEEHSECTSIKGRFHQYFIHGGDVDCSAWKTDYKNCKLWRDTGDETAFKELVASEEKRRSERLKPHYTNTVWKKRETPPADWNKPLPEWLEKENSVSYLGIKAAEMHGGANPTIQRQLCTIL